MKKKYVKLLQRNFGYLKGDIAIVKEETNYDCIVFVPNRISNSALAPFVGYPNHWVEESTEEKYNKQHSIVNRIKTNLKSSMKVKCIKKYGSAKVGTVYDTSNAKEAKALFGLSWKDVLYQYGHLNVEFVLEAKKEEKIIKPIIKTKQMKKFKNKIAVKGSLALREAFRDELLAIGYTWRASCTNDGDEYPCLINHWSQEFGLGYYGTNDYKVYTLPEQYLEALAAASEEEVEKPVAKKKAPAYLEAVVNLTGITKGKIYPYNGVNIIDGKFNNYCYKPEDEGRYFKPATKVAFDKQNKPVYKVGDWLIVKGYCNEYDNKPLHVERISAGNFFYFDNTSDGGKGANFATQHIVRHATAAEIKKATLPTFKIGDWVVVLSRNGGTSNKVGDCGTITEISGSYRVTVKNNRNSGNYSSAEHIRLATPAEIIAITPTTFKIGDWVIGWHASCKNFKTVAWQIGAIKDNTYCSPTDLSYTTGLVNIKLATYDQIVEALKNKHVVGSWVKRTWTDGDVDTFKIEAINNSSYKFSNYVRVSKRSYAAVPERGDCNVYDKRFVDVVIPAPVTDVMLVRGTSDIKIVIKKGRIEADGGVIPIQYLEHLYKIMTNTVFEGTLNWSETGASSLKGSKGSAAISFPTVKLGCSTFTIVELKEVIEAYHKCNA